VSRPFDHAPNDPATGHALQRKAIGNSWMRDAEAATACQPEPAPGAEADDLALTTEEWLDLQYAYNYGTIEPAPGTVEARAFRQMDDYARREVERVAAAEAADGAWRASRTGPAPQADPEAGS
jgi:hypothetical protein